MREIVLCLHFVSDFWFGLQFWKRESNIQERRDWLNDDISCVAIDWMLLIRSTKVIKLYATWKWFFSIFLGTQIHLGNVTMNWRKIVKTNQITWNWWKTRFTIDSSLVRPPVHFSKFARKIRKDQIPFVLFLTQINLMIEVKIRHFEFRTIRIYWIKNNNNCFFFFLVKPDDYHMSNSRKN